MWIVLPSKTTSLDSLVKGLNAETVEAWRRNVYRREGTINLPRFQMRFKVEAELKEALQGMGMRKAFENADLQGIGVSPLGALYIGRVIHEAVVKVNEEGTEAAAATIVEILAERMPPPPFTMICDRPFLFFITDEPTGSILFAGAVHNPEDLD